VPLAELAARLRLAQTTVTHLVRRAEEAGLIAREQSQSDGRVAILRLTPKGERRLARSFHAHEGERRRLRELLEQLTD
jgi:DNA-binding MarR family transcriptional regulator